MHRIIGITAALGAVVVLAMVVPRVGPRAADGGRGEEVRAGVRIVPGRSTPDAAAVLPIAADASSRERLMARTPP